MYLRFLVVILHTSCIFSVWIKPLTRCAVPCFFMISGWLFFDDDLYKTEKRIKRSLYKILLIFVCSTFLFALIKEGVNLTLGKGFYITFT